MFKNTLTVSLVLILVTSVAFAQSRPTVIKKAKKPEPFRGHELVAGYGRIPVLLVAKTNNYYGARTITGPASLTYRYHMSKLLSLGASATFVRIAGDRSYVLYNGTVSTTYYTSSLLHFAPEVTFNYGEAANGAVRFYGVAGVGVGVIVDTKKSPYGSEKEKHIAIGGLGVPFGIRVGKKLGGFLELGFSYKGLVHGGVTYRFGQRQY